MGQVSHAGLAALVRRYQLDTFVETGTGWGVSLREAMQTEGLRAFHSIEVDAETYRRNVEVFKDDLAAQRLQLWYGRSADVLPLVIEQCLSPAARVCWYLDAHFPGSGREVPVPMLPLQGHSEDMVPVWEEVCLIRYWRLGAPDVFIIDDRALWEVDEYEVDHASALRTAVNRNDIAAIEELLSASHDCMRTRVDAGYAIFIPRTR